MTSPHEIGGINGKLRNVVGKNFFFFISVFKPNFGPICGLKIVYSSVFEIYSPEIGPKLRLKGTDNLQKTVCLVDLYSSFQPSCTTQSHVLNSYVTS